MSNSFKIVFFDEQGQPYTPELEEAVVEATPVEATTETTRIESGDLLERAGVTFEYKICHIDGVPDVKSEIVWRTIKKGWFKMRVPTVALRKRSCNTDFVAIIRVATDELVPIVKQCAVAAAIVVAPPLIASIAVTVGTATPVALAAALEAFCASIAGCLALKGYTKKVFDVALDQRKSCTPWEPMV